jgi:hypothetical protein
MTLPKRVVLHVGMTKAGSTAIQNFLDREYDALIERGILFPRSVLTRKDPTDATRTSGHLELVRRLRLDDPNGLDGFFAECARDGLHTLLLSAENLFHHVEPDDLARLANLLDGCEIHLVAILRSQNDWLTSRYFESVTKGYARENRTFDAFVQDALASGALDYQARIAALSDALRPAETHVLDYDALHGENSLVSRFAAIAGFDCARAKAADAVIVNASESFPEAIEAHRRLNPVARCLDTSEYRAWCADMRADARALGERGVLRQGGILSSLPVRKAVSEAVARPNEALAARYFSGAPFGPDAAWTRAPETELDSALVGELFYAGGRKITERRDALRKIARKRAGGKPPPSRQFADRVSFDLPPEESDALRECYAGAGAILEYGGSGATLLASGLTEKYVMTAESVLDQALKLQLHLDTADLPSPAVVHPVPVGPAHRYALEIWDEPFFRHPDVILVAGRFRPACLAAAMMRATRPLTLLFHDYAGRPEHRMMEPLLRPDRMIGRMALFALAPGPFPREQATTVMGAFADAG